MDSKMDLDVSESGWNFEVMAYTVVVNINEKRYMFYNSNVMVNYYRKERM